MLDWTFAKAVPLPPGGMHQSDIRAEVDLFPDIEILLRTCIASSQLIDFVDQTERRDIDQHRQFAHALRHAFRHLEWRPRGLPLPSQSSQAAGVSSKRNRSQPSQLAHNPPSSQRYRPQDVLLRTRSASAATQLSSRASHPSFGKPAALQTKVSTNHPPEPSHASHR